MEGRAARRGVALLCALSSPGSDSSGSSSSQNKADSAEINVIKIKCQRSPRKEVARPGAPGRDSHLLNGRRSQPVQVEWGKLGPNSQEEKVGKLASTY